MARAVDDLFETGPVASLPPCPPVHDRAVSVASPAPRDTHAKGTAGASVRLRARLALDDGACPRCPRRLVRAGKSPTGRRWGAAPGPAKTQPSGRAWACQGPACSAQAVPPADGQPWLTGVRVLLHRPHLDPATKPPATLAAGVATRASSPSQTRATMSPRRLEPCTATTTTRAPRAPGP